MVQVIQPRDIGGEIGQAIGGGLGQALGVAAQRGRISDALDLLSQQPASADPVESYMNVAKALGGVPGAEQFITPISQMLRARAIASATTGPGGTLDALGAPAAAGVGEVPGQVAGAGVPTVGLGQPQVAGAPGAQVVQPTVQQPDMQDAGGLGPREAGPAQQELTVPPLSVYRQRYQDLMAIDPDRAEKMAQSERAADLDALQEQRAKAGEEREREQFQRAISAAQQSKLESQVQKNLGEQGMKYREDVGRYATNQMSKYLNDPKYKGKSEEELVRLVGKDVENVVDNLTSLEDLIDPGERLYPTDRKDFLRRIPQIKKQVRELAKETKQPKFQEEIYTRGLEVGLTKPEALDLAYPPDKGVEKAVNKFKRQVGTKLRTANFAAPSSEKAARARDKMLADNTLVDDLVKGWNENANPAQIKGELVKSAYMTDEQADQVLSEVSDRVSMTGEQKRWLADSLDRYEPVMSEMISRFWDFFDKRT